MLFDSSTLGLNSLVIGCRDLGCENQPIGNHVVGIFWCDMISSWAPFSRSNEESQS